MDTLHPSVKYGLFLVVLFALTYGIIGPLVAPVQRSGYVVISVVMFALVGLIGRKLTKNSFVGFAAVSLACLGVSAYGMIAL